MTRGVKWLTSFVVLAAALTAVTPASAHLAYKARNNTMEERLRVQTLNLAHARYVCENGAGEHRRWSCKAVVWIGRERDKTDEALTSPTYAIRRVFGGYWQQAVAVARCESGLSTWAQNGQYLGMFQMGSSERSLYGHGWSALAQAEAAHRYFVASGRDWSPWQCKPW